MFKDTIRMLNRLSHQRVIIENDILEESMKKVLLKNGDIVELSEWQKANGQKENWLSYRLAVNEVADKRHLLVSEYLIEVFEKIRTLWGKPLIINSGYRTEAHQVKLVEDPRYKAAISSPHCRGYALDIDTKSKAETLELLDCIRSLDIDFIRIGWENYLNAGQTFIHIDIAPFYHGYGRVLFAEPVKPSWRESGKEW